MHWSFGLRSVVIDMVLSDVIYLQASSRSVLFPLAEHSRRSLRDFFGTVFLETWPIASV